MKSYIIFVDGSDLKHTTHRMGIGGILIDKSTEKDVDSFSKELPLDYLESNYGTSDCSNPTAETIAVKYALEYWKSTFKKGDEVLIKQDYIGVSHWVEGSWKINKPYIRKAVMEIRDLVKETGINLKFEWVKGHQTGQSIYGSDKYWNDKVDLLAKGK